MLLLPRSTLFPYTTLFRSFRQRRRLLLPLDMQIEARRHQQAVEHQCHAGLSGPWCVHRDSRRSEEHTSELQSRENLVCRLLLEKKKKIRMITRSNLQIYRE